MVVTITKISRIAKMSMSETMMAAVIADLLAKCYYRANDNVALVRPQPELGS